MRRKSVNDTINCLLKLKDTNKLSQYQNKNDMKYMAELIESGKVKPVIDTIYPLDQVLETFKHYETGRSRGKVIISVVKDS